MIRFLIATAALVLSSAVAADDQRSRTEFGADVQRGMIVEVLQQAPSSAGAEISVALPITFAFGSANLSAEGRSILATTALALNSQELIGLSFVVEGHTDSVGSEQANLVLSQRRADAARNFLIEQGVAAPRLAAIGFGETRLIPQVVSTDGRQRRVEIVRQGG
ncbi:OmpA family protein [Polycyclovorans algicola]|uniref:OmpA family protein n=1 Tax=Polycyclovorans algicola TaxID=616992 RepID=UPI000694E318|nr:OmpA family protein [Polycyclovorans algicola]